MTKLSKLSNDNVRALGETYDRHPVLVALTATTATFDGTPTEVARSLNELIQSLPGRGHPRASLHAVLRRALAQIQPATPEEIARLVHGTEVA